MPLQAKGLMVASSGRSWFHPRPWVGHYSQHLEKTLAKVVSARGEIVKPIFSFPGGRRFHFTEPSGNEFAVWSEPEA